VYSDFDSLQVPVIIITGKGFPDLATRMFTKRLADELKLPVIGLCDWNPFGIALLLTYKFGSLRMGDTAYKYAVDLKWAGLQSAEIDELDIPDSCRQLMTEVDKSKATSMLNGNLMLDEANFADDPSTLQDVSTMRAELRVMLDRGYKLELESIMSQGMDYFSQTYLPNLLTKKNWKKNPRGHDSRWQRRREDSQSEQQDSQYGQDNQNKKRRQNEADMTIDGKLEESAVQERAMRAIRERERTRECGASRCGRVILAVTGRNEEHIFPCAGVSRTQLVLRHGAQ
jgi:hypothetical protein